MKFAEETAANRKIGQLEKELREARYAIVELGLELALEYERHAPPPPEPASSGDVIAFPGASPRPAEPEQPPLDALFRSYYSCQSRGEFGRWRRQLIDRLIELAGRDTRQSRFELSPRSYCPLCRSTPSAPYGDPGGYTLPEGLERHLEGRGNTYHCPVMQALYATARDALEATFAEAERVAAEQEAARRRTETTYLINPFEPPRLLDESWYLEAPRNAEQLTAAEQRLRDLGFARETDGNVVAYKFRQEAYVVLADPRAAGKLRFCVYDERRAGRLPRLCARRYSEFYLLDSWRTDLVAKFQARLAKAIATLMPPAQLGPKSSKNPTRGPLSY
jgi:hypothetical protein